MRLVDDLDEHDEDLDPPAPWMRYVADHDGGFQAACFGGMAAGWLMLFWWAPPPPAGKTLVYVSGVFIVSLGPIIAIGVFAAITACWRYHRGPWWAFFALGAAGSLGWVLLALGVASFGRLAR